MKLKSIWALGAMSILTFILPSLCAAQSEPINIALFNPIQIFSEDNSIRGLRINLIYGKNVSMVGLDWGLINHVGTGGMTGVQWGFVNICDGDFLGWQSGLLNLSMKNVEGFQYGLFNTGEHVSGFQLGVVNYAGSMKGLQIGIINIIKTGGFMPVFPIVNWSF